jgi:hypothetical protein
MQCRHRPLPHHQSVNLVKKAGGAKGLADTDYIFLAKTAHLGFNVIDCLLAVATGVLITRLGRQ